jgi:hypothetical protein
MHPVSSNSVRIMAGTDAFQEDINVINGNCILLTINSDNSVMGYRFTYVE